MGTDLVITEGNDMSRQGDNLLACGREAWKRIKGGHTFEDWQTVGAALELLREEARRVTGCSKGGPFNRAFGALMQDNGFEDFREKRMNKTLADLNLMTMNLSTIVAWRGGLETDKRLLNNHPSTIIRNWKSSLRPPRPRADMSEKEKLRDAVVDLQAKLDANNKGEDSDRVRALQRERDDATFKADRLEAQLELYQSDEVVMVKLDAPLACVAKQLVDCFGSDRATELVRLMSDSDLLRNEARKATVGPEESTPAKKAASAPSERKAKTPRKARKPKAPKEKAAKAA